MKKLMRDIRTWPVNHDLMTDKFYTEEDRERDGDGITERSKIILIIITGLTGWFLTAAVLWPM